MIALFGRLPAPVFALVMVTIFVGVGLALLALVQRTLKALHFEDATEFGEIFSDAIGVIFALIFAFVTIAVWQNYDRISDSVSKEANTLHNIYRGLESYPAEIRNPGREMLKAYVHQVVEQEWSLLSKAQQDPAAHRTITDFARLVNGYRPANLGELPLHSQMLQLVAQYRGLRHDRIKGGEPNLDTPMWTALGVGSLIFLVYSCMYRMPALRHHVFMVASLGASLGLVFFLLLVYNFPFSGPGAIGPDPFKRLVEDYWVID